MRNFLSQCLLSALMLSCSTALTAASKKQDMQAAVQLAEKASDNGDCQAALKIIDGQIASRQFADSTESTKSHIYWLGMVCAWRAKQWASALRYSEAATRLPSADSEWWEVQLQLLSLTGKAEETVVAVEGLSRDKPDILNAIAFKTWGPAYRLLKDNTDLRRRLLKVLTSPRYMPKEPGASTASFHYAYAILLAEGGDKAGAASDIAQIDDPWLLKLITLDPRLRELLPKDFNMGDAVERHMARIREVAAAHAGAISPQLDVANDLLMLYKVNEALATLDAIDPRHASLENFDDSKEQLNWWWDSRARALALLGRYDAAVDAYMQGQKHEEFSQPNISQTINLSELQLRFGRPADALKTLEPIVAGKISGSPFGLMQFHSNHGCANFQIGKVNDAAEDLNYLRDHVADAPAAFTSLLLCMGKIDDAAASLVKRLDTPDQRIEALMDLSDYLSPPPTYPAYPSERGLALLKARPDVQAAIARAGGTRKFNIAQ